jgi:cytochrome oxidase assembly protein ShyY1
VNYGGYVRRLRFLLRSGWIVFILVVVVFAYLCFSVLAPWQLGKNVVRSERNDLISSSLKADPVPLSQVVPGEQLSASDEWKPVTATGRYAQDNDWLVRLRSIEGSPSFEVLTPLLLDDGRALLVNRGYVRPREGSLPPAIEPAPPGEVTLLGRLRVSEGTAKDRGPVTIDGVNQVYMIDAPEIGQAAGVPMIDGYLQLAADQPGGFGTVPLPQLESGPYLSYGLQWLAFGIMAPLGLGYFVWAELKERRREDEDDDAEDDSDEVGEPREPAPPQPEPGQFDEDGFEIPAALRAKPKKVRARKQVPERASASSAKLSDRYGR